MMKWILALLIAIGLSYLIKETRMGTWRPCVSAEGRYEVMMPGPSEEFQESVKYSNNPYGLGPSRDLPLRWATARWRRKGQSFDVGYLDFPDKLPPDSVYRQIPKFMGKFTFYKSAQELTAKTDISVGGWPAQEFRIESVTGEVVKKYTLLMARAVLVDQRLYLLVAIFEKTGAPKKDEKVPVPENFKKFFDSFKVK